MISKVEIINIALSRIGESPIQSLDEGTVPANMAKVFYDPARRSTLRDYNWNFSLRTARLAKLDETPGDFLFAFSLPVDCLRAVAILGGASPHHLVRGRKLLSNEEAVTLEYIADVTDTSEFDDKFVEALTYKLASELAMPVKGSVELMANYANVYSTKVNQAAALSAGESNEGLSDNPYLEARFSGYR